MQTFVRFERGRDGVIGPTYGPYSYVQLTYDLIRVGPDGDCLAYFHRDDWNIFSMQRKEGHDTFYSDVIIYAADKPE